MTSGCRLKKSDKILKKDHFSYIFTSPKKIEGLGFSVMFKPSFLLSGRVGFVASKKIGNAVKRNAIKRRLRELYRLSQDNFPTHLDFIFSPKHGCLDMSFKKMLLCLQALPIKDCMYDR